MYQRSTESSGALRESVISPLSKEGEIFGQSSGAVKKLNSAIYIYYISSVKRRAIIICFVDRF